MSGKVAATYSESETLVRVIRDLQQLRRSVGGEDRNRCDRSILLLQELAEQAHAGIHKNPRRKNPGLVIYNPLVVRRPASKNRFVVGIAEQVKYAYNGKGYVHDFESGPTIQGVTDGGHRILEIVSMRGAPLWATQDEVDRGSVET